MILAGDDADSPLPHRPPSGRGQTHARLDRRRFREPQNANAAAVRDAYATFSAGTETDLWLMLGDNAYPERHRPRIPTARCSILFPDLLRETVVWPAFGNHDAISSNAVPMSGPYFEMFSLPTGGEVGGVSSGTEVYYSFDYANIHFVVLDSQTSDRTPGSAMLTWLEADLAATAQDWLIAYWHHPPYSKGSHDSDTESASDRDARERPPDPRGLRRRSRLHRA